MTTHEMRIQAEQNYPVAARCGYVQCEARHDDYRGRFVFSVGGIVIPEWHAAEMLRVAEVEA